MRDHRHMKTVVATGTWLYADSVPTTVRIVRLDYDFWYGIGEVRRVLDVSRATTAENTNICRQLEAGHGSVLQCNATADRPPQQPTVALTPSVPRGPLGAAVVLTRVDRGAVRASRRRSLLSTSSVWRHSSSLRRPLQADAAAHGAAGRSRSGRSLSGHVVIIRVNPSHTHIVRRATIGASDTGYRQLQDAPTRSGPDPVFGAGGPCSSTAVLASQTVLPAAAGRGGSRGRGRRSEGSHLAAVAQDACRRGLGRRDEHSSIAATSGAGASTDTPTRESSGLSGECCAEIGIFALACSCASGHVRSGGTGHAGLAVSRDH